MAQNSRDISLVIRAKNEADRTIKSVADTLGLLNTAQGKAAASAQALQNQLNKAEGSGERNANALRQVTQAVDVQAQKLATTTQQITAYKARITELTPALEKLKREAAIEFVGPTQFAGNLALAKTQIRAIEGEVRKLNSALGGSAKRPGGLESQFTAQIEGFRQTREAQRGLQGSQREIQSAIELTTARLREQNGVLAENRRAANSQAAVNAGFAPGLTRPQNTSADREAIAAVLRVAEARDIATQKLIRETAEQNRLNEARRIYNSIRTAVDQSGGKSAADSGDVFKVRFAAEDEATALKGAAAAHASFEARVKAGAAAMRTAESAAAAEATEIARLKNVLNPAAVAEANLAAETQKLNTWLKAGTISASEHSAALKLIAADSARAAKALNGSQGLDSRGRPSLFGLKPYELQNLSFQINDVFTQLASGTSVTQTLAQQGGQIFQLFPKVGSAIAEGLRSGPIIAAVAAVGTLVVAINTAANAAERLRVFEGLLTLSVDGGAGQAQVLADSARALDLYGLSAENALKVVRSFVKDGFDPTQIEAFGRAAQNMAEVLGIDVIDAAKKLSDAFDGNYESIKKLDDSLNFLTAAQRANLKLLFEQGRGAEALDAASKILQDRLQDGAEKARGPWAASTRDLDQAWGDFLGTLSDNSAITGTLNLLTKLANAAGKTARALSSAQTLADVDQQITDTRESIATDKALAFRAGSKIPIAGPLIAAAALANATANEARLNGLLEKRATILKRVEGQEAATAKVGVAGSERQTKASKDLADASARARNSRDTAPAADQIAAAEDSARRDALREISTLLGENSRFATEGAKQEFIAAKVAAARLAVEKKLTAEARARARETESERKAREAAFAADIANNGRDKLIATAQRFNGFSENNQAQRGDLQSFFKQNGINVDPKMTAWCAAFVNAVLATNGLPGTGKLNAKSFLGYGQDSTANPQVGDIVILNRGNNPAEGHVGFFQGFDDKGNVKVLGGNTNDKVGTQSFARDQVVGVRRAPSLGQVATEQVKEQDQLQAKQDKYNEALDLQIRKRTLDTTQLREQVGLQGDALIEAQKRAAVEDLIAKTIADATTAGVDTTSAEFAARLEALRQVEQGYQDAARAREAFEVARANIDKPVSELSALRDSLRGQIDSLRTNGLSAEADALLPKLSEVNGQLREMIDNAIAAYQAMTPGSEAFPGTREELDSIISKFETLKLGTTEWVTLMGIGGQQIAQLFASTATNALDKFAQAVANGENVFGSLLDAFRQFAADFLRQIAQMIIQQIIFNLVSGILKSVAGGAVPGGGGQSLGAVAGLKAHEGGIIGGAGPKPIAVSPAWFTNATRYHTGGIAGLKPDEVPAILRRGEEVLTEADPRHRTNGGGGGGSGGAPNIKIVNAIDAGDFVSKGLSTRTGEQALLNFIRANAGAVSSAMR